MSEQGGSHPSYAPKKKAQMWPLFAIVGALALVVIAVLMRGSSTPEWAKVPAAEREAARKQAEAPLPPPVPVDPQGLALGSSYVLSAETTAVGDMGGDPAAGGTKFPAGAIVVISSVRTSSGAKWYYVFAKDSGGQQIGWGWIAADWLKGQDLQRR